MFNKEDLRNLSPEEKKNAFNKVIIYTALAAFATVGAHYLGCAGTHQKKPEHKQEQQHKPNILKVSLDSKVEDVDNNFKVKADCFASKTERSVRDLTSRIRNYIPLLTNAANELGQVYGIQNLSWKDLAMLPCAETKFKQDRTEPDYGPVQMTEMHYDAEVKPQIKHNAKLRSLFNGKVPTWEKVRDNFSYNLLAGAISFARYVQKYGQPENNPEGIDPRVLAIVAYNAGQGKLDNILDDKEDIRHTFQDIAKIKHNISASDAMRGMAYRNLMQKTATPSQHITAKAKHQPRLYARR
jgi:hypothetical protein